MFGNSNLQELCTSNLVRVQQLTAGAQCSIYCIGEGRKMIVHMLLFYLFVCLSTQITAFWRGWHQRTRHFWQCVRNPFSFFAQFVVFTLHTTYTSKPSFFLKISNCQLTWKKEKCTFSKWSCFNVWKASSLFVRARDTM